MKIYIVIPVYNEESKVIGVLKEISKTKYPIVVIDDGSTDGSQKKIREAKLKNVTLLGHKINLGKGAVLKTGSDYAFNKGADAVIYMDSDGQHKVSDLNKFVEKLETGKFDIVFGSRNLNFGVPLDRYMGNKLASVLVGFMFGIYVSDLICGFRGLTQKLNPNYFTDHFVTLKQLIYSPWGYGGSGEGLSDGMTFQLGKIHIGLVFGSIILSIIYITIMSLRVPISIGTKQSH